MVGHLGGDPTDTSVDPPVVPDAVVIVVSRMVARVLEREGAGDQPVGAESVTNTTGPFGQTVRFGAGTTSGGPWLTKADKVMLRGGAGVVSSVALSSGRTGRYRLVT